MLIPPVIDFIFVSNSFLALSVARFIAELIKSSSISTSSAEIEDGFSGLIASADNLIDLIVPNYDRLKVTYKHGFKKAQDGHWYWVSSEQVK